MALRPLLRPPEGSLLCYESQPTHHSVQRRVLVCQLSHYSFFGFGAITALSRLAGYLKRGGHNKQSVPMTKHNEGDGGWVGWRTCRSRVRRGGGPAQPAALDHSAVPIAHAHGAHAMAIHSRRCSTSRP